MPTYEGRLELILDKQHLRLLAHEDGSYESIPPSDYRMAEVRLLTVDEKTGVPCRYLLVSESDIETAKGSWDALKALGT